MVSTFTLPSITPDTLGIDTNGSPPTIAVRSKAPRKSNDLTSRTVNTATSVTTYEAVPVTGTNQTGKGKEDSTPAQSTEPQRTDTGGTVGPTRTRYTRNCGESRESLRRYAKRRGRLQRPLHLKPQEVKEERACGKKLKKRPRPRGIPRHHFRRGINERLKAVAREASAIARATVRILLEVCYIPVGTASEIIRYVNDLSLYQKNRLVSAWRFFKAEAVFTTEQQARMVLEILTNFGSSEAHGTSFRIETRDSGGNLKCLNRDQILEALKDAIDQGQLSGCTSSLRSSETFDSRSMTSF